MTVASPEIVVAATGGGIPITWILLALLAVFWIFLIMQNRKRRAAQISQRESISTGSKVLLTSGFIGTLVSRDGDQAEIELAPGLTVKVLVGAIARTVDDAPTIGTDDTVDTSTTGLGETRIDPASTMPDAPRRSTDTVDAPVADTFGSTGATTRTDAVTRSDGATRADSAITEDGAPRRD